MAKRKPWNQLKPEYRARLESKGITQKAFDSGADIKAARGHAQTPERPTSFDASKFPKYAAERNRLTAQLKQKKEEMFGSRPRWHAERADRNLREYPPTMAQLRWAVDPGTTEDDFIHEIREDPKTYRFLLYG